ncbi:MAG TPA: PAS domain S-box protein, partial [Chitinophagaceae bacterium]|nr:PAS domain S-box protein [Chitinophagaceae bacterium]
VLLQTIPTQGAMLVERQIMRKDGLVIDVEISARKLPDGRLQSIVRDITDRKKAASALAESEAKFKNLVEQSLVGVYIIQENRFVYVNPQMSAIYGYTREEMLAMPTVLETVDPAERDKVKHNLALRITGEINSLNYEFCVKNKNGETLYIEVFGNRILYNGQPAIIGTAINNTQRKKAEREIERSNERFMLLARATNDAMWDWDMLNDQVWWNEKHYALYGLDPGAKPLDFESWRERIHPADRNWVSDDLEKAIADKKSMWEAEYRFRMPDGIYGNVYDRVYIVYENGRLVRMLGSVMDITHRVKAEEQLKASEQKYKLLFEYNPLPMWMLSLPDRKFIDVNEAALKQYGYSREEFMQLDILAIRPPDDVPRFMEQTRKHRDGIDYAGVWRHIRKNGDLLEVEIITHDIYYQDRPAQLVLAIDVTEKQQYERRIKETNAQLRELSAHLQDIREEERLNIAREIHDELGQLLTVLKMDVSWLKKKMPD